MSKRIIDIDWESYAQTYPDRYLNYSSFDAKVEAEIAKRDQAEVLDIGGGKNGTSYLRQWYLKCWLLDPHIKEAPEWMHGNLSWASANRMQFDVIVARGCFNCLSKIQIQTIFSMLKPAGRFMFNTFYKPKTGFREYQNSRSETQGVERFQYRSKKNVIEHELEPYGEDYVIRHTFFAYKLDEIIEMLGVNGLSFKFLGPNSLFVSLCR